MAAARSEKTKESPQTPVMGARRRGIDMSLPGVAEIEPFEAGV